MHNEVKVLYKNNKNEANSRAYFFSYILQLHKDNKKSNLDKLKDWAGVDTNRINYYNEFERYHNELISKEYGQLDADGNFEFINTDRNIKELEDSLALHVSKNFNANDFVEILKKNATTEEYYQKINDFGGSLDENIANTFLSKMAFVASRYTAQNLFSLFQQSQGVLNELTILDSFDNWKKEIVENNKSITVNKGQKSSFLLQPQKKFLFELDENGKKKLDANNQPIYILDRDGKKIVHVTFMKKHVFDITQTNAFANNYHVNSTIEFNDIDKEKLFKELSFRLEDIYAIKSERNADISLEENIKHTLNAITELYVRDNHIDSKQSEIISSMLYKYYTNAYGGDIAKMSFEGVDDKLEYLTQTLNFFKTIDKQLNNYDKEHIRYIATDFENSQNILNSELIRENLDSKTKMAKLSSIELAMNDEVVYEDERFVVKGVGAKKIKLLQFDNRRLVKTEWVDLKDIAKISKVNKEKIENTFNENFKELKENNFIQESPLKYFLVSGAGEDDTIVHTKKTLQEVEDFADKFVTFGNVREITEAEAKSEDMDALIINDEEFEYIIRENEKEEAKDKGIEVAQTERTNKVVFTDSATTNLLNFRIAMSNGYEEGNLVSTDEIIAKAKENPRDYELKSTFDTNGNAVQILVNKDEFMLYDEANSSAISFKEPLRKYVANYYKEHKGISLDEITLIEGIKVVDATEEQEQQLIENKALIFRGYEATKNNASYLDTIITDDEIDQYARDNYTRFSQSQRNYYQDVLDSVFSGRATGLALELKFKKDIFDSSNVKEWLKYAKFEESEHQTNIVGMTVFGVRDTLETLDDYYQKIIDSEAYKAYKEDLGEDKASEFSINIKQEVEEIETIKQDEGFKEYNVSLKPYLDSYNRNNGLTFRDAPENHAIGYEEAKTFLKDEGFDIGGMIRNEISEYKIIKVWKAKQEQEVFKSVPNYLPDDGETIGNDKVETIHVETKESDYYLSEKIDDNTAYGYKITKDEKLDHQGKISLDEIQKEIVVKVENTPVTIDTTIEIKESIKKFDYEFIEDSNDIQVMNIKDFYTVKEIDKKFINKSVQWVMFQDDYIFDLENPEHRELLKDELHIDYKDVYAEHFKDLNADSLGDKLVVMQAKSISSFQTLRDYLYDKRAELTKKYTLIHKEDYEKVFADKNKEGALRRSSLSVLELINNTHDKQFESISFDSRKELDEFVFVELKGNDNQYIGVEVKDNKPEYTVSLPTKEDYEFIFNRSFEEHVQNEHDYLVSKKTEYLELQADLSAKRITPSKVIGTGYKNPAKVAKEWIEKQLVATDEHLERGFNYTTLSNFIHLHSKYRNVVPTEKLDNLISLKENYPKDIFYDKDYDNLLYTISHISDKNINDNFKFNAVKVEEVNTFSDDEIDRLKRSFAEIQDFIIENGREPNIGAKDVGDIIEFQLGARLNALRSDSTKIEILKDMDEDGILETPSLEFKDTYYYGLNNRPVSIGTVPDGYTVIQDTHEEFRHGIVSYDSKLSNDDIRRFELTDLSLEHFNYVADEIIESMGKYGQAYSDDNEELDIKVQTSLDGYVMRVAPSRVDELKSLVKSKLEQKLSEEVFANNDRFNALASSLKETKLKVSLLPSMNEVDILDTTNRTTMLMERVNINVAEQLLATYRSPDELKGSAEYKKYRGTTLEDDVNIEELSNDISSVGAKTKFKNNIKALDVLEKVKGQDSLTKADRNDLRKYVGWGGLPQAFYKTGEKASKGWEKEAELLKSKLSEKEYEDARASTLNAHYTPLEVSQAMWKAIQRFDFKGGKVSEPSVGIGGFLTTMPTALKSKVMVDAVELDTLTANILKNIHTDRTKTKVFNMGFEDFDVPNDTYSLVIGNPPFGKQKLFEKEYNHLNLNIHNHFFVKSIDKLKEDGVLAMVVSSNFLDSSNSSGRDYIGDKARLISAIRLPNNAFSKNAGTQVTTDIIFLQKTSNKERLNYDEWSGNGELNDTPINNYFVTNPQNLLGDWGKHGTMFRGDEPALIPNDGQDTLVLLNEAIENIDTTYYTTYKEVEEADAYDADGKLKSIAYDSEGRIAQLMSLTDSKVVLDAEVIKGYGDSTGIGIVANQIKKGAMFVYEDILYKKIKTYTETDFETEEVKTLNEIEEVTTKFNSKFEEVELKAKETEKLKGMANLALITNKLIDAQVDAMSDEKDIEALRTELNTTYDAFVKQFEMTNNPTNKRLFEDDSNASILLALEDNYQKAITSVTAKKTGEKSSKELSQKANIFSLRTQYPYKRPTRADDVISAYQICLSEYGDIDEDYIVRLLSEQDKSWDEISKYLFENNLIFETERGYETREEYLSGNVKAKAKVTDNPKNLKALEEVTPEDLEYHQIIIKAGVTWMQQDDVADFIAHISGDADSKAYLIGYTGKWTISTKPTFESKAEYATEEATVNRILDALINSKQITITYKDEDGTVRTDTEASLTANSKVEALKREWEDWLWDSQDRRERLPVIYNEMFNVYSTKAFDGSHLTLQGKVDDDVITMRPHQVNAVWRNTITGKGLLDHTVGSGKTFTAITTVMEAVKMGKATKPLVVVPNHITEQWGADFIKLYPNAKVLVPTAKDFSAKRRQLLFSRIATGNYDAIIIGHSQLIRLENNKEFETEFIKKDIKEVQDSIDMLRYADGVEARSIKDLESAKKNLEFKLQTLTDVKRDEGFSFDKLGIDYLVIDESHEFKNLQFTTSMSRIKGLGNPMGSQKAFDLFLKTRFIQENFNNRNILFLTGTPISNSMAEMYNILKYMHYTELKEMGIVHFDAWAKQFTDAVTDWELDATGRYKMVTRLAKFINMPELMGMYNQVADIVNNEQIEDMLKKQGKTLGLPKIKEGKTQIVVIPRSEQQANFFGEPDDDNNYPRGSLIGRAESLSGKPEKGEDNHLVIMSDAKKSSLDMRLIDESYEDLPDNKINIMLNNAMRLYEKWGEDKGTQLIFSDLGTPKGARSEEKKILLDLLEKSDQGDTDATEALDKYSSEQIEEALSNNNFSVYEDIKEKLIARGVPEHEIVFIHSAKTPEQKAILFGKVRSGSIRFLLGSTQKMGAGTNVQDKLVGLHHMDVPFRPSDIEQRNGRIIRQGNKLLAKYGDEFEIELFVYCTEKTLDAKLWEIIEKKAKFIEQIKLGNIKDRDFEDMSLDSMTAGEIKALASGNPLILEEMTIKNDISKMETVKKAFMRSMHVKEAQLMNIERDLEMYPKEIESLKIDNDTYQKNIKLVDEENAFGKEIFSMTIGEKVFEELLIEEPLYTPNEVYDVFHKQEFDFFQENDVKWAIDFEYGKNDFGDNENVILLSEEPHIFWSEVLADIESGVFRKHDLVLSVQKSIFEDNEEDMVIDDKIILCEDKALFTRMLPKSTQELLAEKEYVDFSSTKVSQRVEAGKELLSVLFDLKLQNARALNQKIGEYNGFDMIVSSNPLLESSFEVAFKGHSKHATVVEIDGKVSATGTITRLENLLPRLESRLHHLIGDLEAKKELHPRLKKVVDTKSFDQQEALDALYSRHKEIEAQLHVKDEKVSSDKSSEDNSEDSKEGTEVARVVRTAPLPEAPLLSKNQVKDIFKSLMLMPKSGDLESVDTKPIGLKLFNSNMTMYIVEADKGSSDDEVVGLQTQAYGYRENTTEPNQSKWGYINVEELVAQGYEKDMFFDDKFITFNGIVLSEDEAMSELASSYLRDNSTSIKQVSLVREISEIMQGKDFRFVGKHLLVNSNLERSDYTQVSKFCDTCGGTWNKKTKSIIFDSHSKALNVKSLMSVDVNTILEASKINVNKSSEIINDASQEQSPNSNRKKSR